jgi:hypothetical protein
MNESQIFLTAGFIVYLISDTIIYIYDVSIYHETFVLLLLGIPTFYYLINKK